MKIWRVIIRIIKNVNTGISCESWLKELGNDK